MKILSKLLMVPLLGLVAVSVRADDKASLAEAQRAQNDAPAYRMKAVSTDVNTKEATVITLESVKPDLLHMKTEAGGKTQMEIVSDGKKAFMSQGGAELTEAPPQVAAMIGQARQQSSLDAMTKLAQDVKITGHEAVNGVPASVYTFSTDMMGLHSASKLWVSDKDHRPLKGESTTQGELKMGEQSKKMDQQTSITFDYDPSIKIALPGN